MIYFTSDAHFCHNNIIKMCNRPFADIEEMHDVLIKNWNTIVGKTDEVYILGDLIYKGKAAQANEILKELHGRKYLIKGNHERYLDAPDFDVSAFQWVKDYYVLDYKDARYILFHYPIVEWAHYHRKSVHLFGHIHNSKFKHPKDRAINVSVDNNAFRPVSAEGIYKQAFEVTE